MGGPVSPPPHWLERGTPQPSPRSSSIRRTAACRRWRRKRRSAIRRRRPRESSRPGRGRPDSYTDRSLYDRCITRGIAGSFLPVIYNNGNEIVQGPGWVALRNEMIHERGSSRSTAVRSSPRRSAVHGRLARALGRQHAGRRDDQLQRPDVGDQVNGGGNRHSGRR